LRNLKINIFFENKIKVNIFWRKFMIDDELLKIIACPKCKGDLEYVKGEEEFFDCHKCKLRYPIRNDIPVMLIDQALILEDNTR